MSLPKTYDEFVLNHPIFDKTTFSKQLRKSLIRPLQGLGLPTPRYGRKTPFGYENINNVFIPIEKELLILHTAVNMIDGDYYLDDIHAWFNSAITTPRSLRTFQYIRFDRPTFPEIKLPLEERIKIFYGIAPATSQEVRKEISESNLETGFGEGEESSIEGDGTAEG